MSAPKIITHATVEPVTAEQSWAHLRVLLEGSPPEPADAADIADKLKAARELAEAYTGRSLALLTLEMALDEFPGENDEIELPNGTISAITSVKYIDEDGVEQTMDPALYELDEYVTPRVLRPVYGEEWPATREQANAVKIRFESGYSNPAESPQTNPMPAGLRIGILLILAHLYENREETSVASLKEIPLGACAHLEPHRIRKGFA